jgi:hypothetical protein
MHRIINAIRLLRLSGLAPLTFALLLTGACGTASAEVWTKLPVTAALPADGASLTAFPTPYPEDVIFAIESPTTGLIGPKVNIAAENAVNSNGRLFPEVTVESLYLKESERYPEAYAGYSTYEPWATIPGTYYWQFEGRRLESVEKCEWNPYLGEERCSPTSEWFNYLSPVYTLVITPKPAPPPASPPPAPPPTPMAQPQAATVPALTLGEASSFVKSYIKRRFHRRAAHVTTKCRLTGRQTARCDATWYSALHITATTSRYAGRFSVNARYEPMTLSFTGTRTQVGCLRRYSAKHCASKVHWHGFR